MNVMLPSKILQIKMRIYGFTYFLHNLVRLKDAKSSEYNFVCQIFLHFVGQSLQKLINLLKIIDEFFGGICSQIIFFQDVEIDRQINNMQPEKQT